MSFVPKVLLRIKLPVTFNNDRIIPALYFIELEKKFVKEYGGYTRVIPPSRGEWKDKRSGRVYLDRSISYEVFIERSRFEETVESQLDDLIEDLKEKFEQEAIDCYYFDVTSTDFSQRSFFEENCNMSCSI
ncbi:MAG: hypothetical protein PXX83_06685 [Candidatus Nitrosotalea sp.]|nr:hypothetical protein [Candidatus Nitrosotalea sp.]